MDTESLLTSLINKPWEKIVITHGNSGFEETSIKANYAFGLFFTWINNKWIYIYATELDEGIFVLELKTIDCIPVSEPWIEKCLPKKIVTKFPEDCRLDFLKTEKIKSIRIDKNAIKKEDCIQLKYFKITLSNKYKFLFKASDVSPCDLEIRMLAPAK